MTVCPECRTSYPDNVRICPADGAVLDTDGGADPRLGSLLGGKYRLDAVAGRGGMGVVYRATHVMLGKTVAVKLINKDLAPSADVVLRFQREARAAGRLDHPNIAAVYDLGQTDDGTLYFAMEFVAGTSLKDVIRSQGPIAPARIVRIAGQIASALSVAHRHSIIHRDLKPQNVIVGVDADGRERARLLDFGIARSFAEDATQVTSTGLALGTPHYMSPEQAAGQTLDARSDLYSLGVMLYEMLIGVVPFDDPSTPAVLIKHLNEAPQRPSLRRPDIAVSPEIEAIALRCLDKDPSRRYASADELLRALAAIQPAGDEETAPALAALGAAPAAPEPDPDAAEPSGKLPGGGALPPPSALRNLTSVGPVDQPPGSQPHSAGSSIVLGVLLLLVVGGVGFAAYGLGYFTGSSDDPRPPVAQPLAAIDSGIGEAGPVPVQESGAAPDITNPDDSGVAAAGPAPPPATAQPDPTPPARAVNAITPPPAPAPPTDPRPRTGPDTTARVEPEPRQQATPPPPPRPEHPSVRFGCDGPAQVCGTLQSILQQTLRGALMTSIADEAQAELLVDALVVAGTPTSQQMFGTTMVITPYTVSFAATDRRTKADIAMPAPTSFTMDDRVGQNRLTEQSRLMSTAVVQRLSSYWRTR